MTDSTSCPAHLADDIAHRLGRLAEHLFHAPPRQAAQILSHVLDTEHGILGQLATLVTTGSLFAKEHTQTGAFPIEVWLALGSAAHDLDGLCMDLDEHLDAIRQLAQEPPTDSIPLPPTPTTSALAARRRR